MPCLSKEIDITDGHCEYFSRCGGKGTHSKMVASNGDRADVGATIASMGEHAEELNVNALV